MQNNLMQNNLLRGLERVVLAETLEAEISVASLVIEVGADASQNYGERAAAWMSAFALCFRNCSSSSVVRRCWADESNFVGCAGLLYKDVLDERLDGHGGQQHDP